MPRSQKQRRAIQKRQARNAMAARIKAEEVAKFFGVGHGQQQATAAVPKNDKSKAHQNVNGNGKRSSNPNMEPAINKKVEDQDMEKRLSSLEDWMGNIVAQVATLEKELQTEKNARQRLEREFTELKFAKQADDARSFWADWGTRGSRRRRRPKSNSAATQ